MAAETAKKRILVWAAMQSELEFVLKEIGINTAEAGENANTLSIERENTTILFVSAPKSERFGCESIGTIAAVLSVDKCIREFNPDIIINCGTAGGFKERGGHIGKVYACSTTIFHDRHISFQPYKNYGICESKMPYCAEIGKKLGFDCGVLTTGDNFDVVSEEEKALWVEYEATCKDMEGAAVAYTVKQWHQDKTIQLIFLKVIVDLLFQEKNQMEQFQKHLKFGCERLGDAMKLLLDALEDPTTNTTFIQKELSN